MTLIINTDHDSVNNPVLLVLLVLLGSGDAHELTTLTTLSTTHGYAVASAGGMITGCQRSLVYSIHSVHNAVVFRDCEHCKRVAIAMPINLELTPPPFYLPPVHP